MEESLDVLNNSVSISIIIPTFNLEDYIGDCLGSLLNQSFEDFEVIVVDDLSTDSTVDIVKFYMKRDNRITLLHNKYKSGSGGSRNLGMKHAKGKYVQFVDGDDWIDKLTLQKVFDVAEEFNTDIVMFKGINFDDSANNFIESDYFSMDVISKFNNQIFSIDDIYDELFKINVVPWNKLYLKSFLDEIGATFPEKYIHQDNPFFYKTFCEAKRVYLLDECFYNRRIRTGSITSLRNDTELGSIEIVEEILKVFVENGLYDKFNVLLLNRLLNKLKNRYNLVGADFRQEYYIRCKKKLFKFMFDYGLFDDLMNNLWDENKKFFNSVVFTDSFDEFLRMK